MTWNSDAVDANMLIDSVNQQIAHLEYIAACREPPTKDGYGGLVKICDDQMFREQGFIREYFPQSPGKDSPGASSAVNSGSAPSDMDPLSDGSYQAAFGESELAPEELPGSQHIEHFKTRKLEERVKQKITPRGLPSDFGMDPPALQPPAKPKMLSEIASKRTRETFDEETSILPEDLRPRNIQNTANTQSNGKLKNEVEKWQAELESLRSGKVPQTKEEKILMAAFIADQAFRAATGNLLNGEFEEAVQLAEIAAGACPADKSSARDKINRLKQVAIRRLQTST